MGAPPGADAGCTGPPRRDPACRGRGLRRRTLRSTLEWSTELLTPAQRRVLQLFSVFVGARLTDVEGTARRLADNIDVLEGMGTLVDNSLVRNIPDEQGHQRLAMLETHHLDTAIEQFDTGSAGLVKFRIGPSPGVVANVVSGLSLWTVGFPDRAVARLERGLTVADEIGHPYSRAYAIWHAALLDLWRFDLSAMAARAETLHALATAHDYPIWWALALVLRGTKMIADGEVDDGLAEVDRGFDLYDDQTTPPVFWPGLLLVRAVGRMLAGRIDEALALVDRSESLVPGTDSLAADLAIMRGDLHMAMAPPDAATAVETVASAGGC